MEKQNTYTYLQNNLYETPKEIVRTYRKMMLEHMEQDLQIAPYENEREIMNCVKEGRPNDIDKCLLKRVNKPEDATPGTMSKDPIKQIQFLVVTGITLITRYALAGGLPEAEAFKLSDAYLQKIDETITEDDANKLIIVAMHDFANRVHNQKSRNNISYRIKKAIGHIQGHLHHKLTLNEISKVCEISPEYLSSQFKKETGINITEYIENEKLNVSASMLAESSFSVARISEILCFPSPSAFSQKFRAKYGTTPHEYRNNHANETRN